MFTLCLFVFVIDLFPFLNIYHKRNAKPIDTWTCVFYSQVSSWMDIVPVTLGLSYFVMVYAWSYYYALCEGEITLGSKTKVFRGLARKNKLFFLLDQTNFRSTVRFCRYSPFHISAVFQTNWFCGSNSITHGVMLGLQTSGSSIWSSVSRCGKYKD